MAFPPGMETVTVTVGPYYDFDGNRITGRIVRLQPEWTLTHAPTGSVVLATPVDIILDQQGTGQAVVPASDASGLIRTNFRYWVTWRFGPLPTPKSTWVYLRKTITTVDLDGIIPSEGDSGTAVPPGGGGSVKTVNGQSPDGDGDVLLTAADISGTFADNQIPGSIARDSELAAAVSPKANTADLKPVAFTGSYVDLTSKPLIPTQPWEIGAQPAGSYATPTDVAAASTADRDRANHTGTQSLDTTTDSATRLALAPAERTKLAGVATGATANSTDAQLRDRATHTGTQAAATITGLATVATSGAYADLSGKPAAQTAGHVIRDEGVDLPQRTVIDFRGAGVTATDDAAGGRTVVTVPASYFTSVLPGVGEWLPMPGVGTSSRSQGNNELRLGPLWLPAGTYDALSFRVESVGSAGAVAKVVAYADSVASPGRPGALLVDTATVDVSSVGGAGTKILSGLSLVAPTEGRLIWVGVVTQGNPGTSPNYRFLGSGPGGTPVPASMLDIGLIYNIATAFVGTGVTGAAPAVGPTTQNEQHVRIAARRPA